MKIFDCFPFNNELRILELRINYLKDVVEKFVIAESSLSFSGNQKNLHASAFVSKLDLPSSKFEIINYEFPDDLLKAFSQDANRWPLERYARQSLYGYISKLSHEDFVILSDVDEIPSLRQIQASTQIDDQISRIATPLTYGKMNWPAKHGADWATVRIGPARLFEDLNKIRYESTQIMSNDPGGHYSDLASTMTAHKDKVRDLAHSEFDVEDSRFDKILEFSMQYRVNHFGLFFRKGFGVPGLLGRNALNKQQELMLSIDSELFDFQKPQYNWPTRVVASFVVTKAWKDDSDLRMPKLIYLNFLRAILIYFANYLKKLISRVIARLKVVSSWY